MLDLRRISHLVALADERHFGRAAERVHLSQPAFSRSIQALEGLAGHRLFDRGSSEVRPTPAGSFLIERARALLADARHLERDLTLFGDSQLGDTAFGVGPLPAATLLPHALAQLRRAHPKVALRVEVNNWILLLDRLQAEDIEFFIADLRSVPADPDLAMQSLGRQPGGFFVRPGHPLAGRRCTPAELWRHGVAATRLPAAILAAIGRLLDLPSGRSPSLVLECDDIGLLREVAQSTDTAIGVSTAALQADLADGTLVQLTVDGLPPLYGEMGAVMLRKRTPSPMARRALEVITAVAREVNEGVPKAGAATRRG
jgi:DNA-binding transcriptional LysR family regulator